MKIMNIEDIDGLFKVIGECEGNVYLIGKDIKLNMKSKLSQYFSLATIFSSKNSVISELELHTENANDTARLVKFVAGGAL